MGHCWGWCCRVVPCAGWCRKIRFLKFEIFENYDNLAPAQRKKRWHWTSTRKRVLIIFLLNRMEENNFKQLKRRSSSKEGFTSKKHKVDTSTTTTTTTSNGQCPLYNLPSDTITQIISYLKLRQILRALYVSKQFQRFAASKQLWGNIQLKSENASWIFSPESFAKFPAIVMNLIETVCHYWLVFVF